MNLAEGLRMAWLAIRGNVLRSFLTALGIIIGVATVIAIVALGQGSRAQVTKAVQSLGTNLVVAVPSPRQGARFTADMAADLASRVPDVVAAMPVIAGSATVVWTNQNYSTTMDGVSEAWPQMHGVGVAQGAFFTSDQVAQHASVAVLGQTVVQNLGFTRGAVGQQVFINGHPFTVTGVLNSIGSSAGGQNQDDVVLIPYTSAELVAGTVYPQQLDFQVKSADDAPLVVGTLQMIFGVMFPRPNSVTVISQNQLLSTLSSVTQTLTVTLGAIAGVSLLVGGIGIMNIMLVSVTERTREIGLRKAIGAKRRSILTQFLMEAALLSCGGGLIGIGLGWGGARLVSRLLHSMAVVTPTSVMLGFGFSLFVGIVFGLWPAAQGARLDPIVALRHD